MTDQMQTIRQNKSLLKQELEAAGAQFKAGAVVCPFHADHTPSGGIYQAEDKAWRFKCQSCGVGGDAFDIRARRTGQPLAMVFVELSADQGPRPGQQRPGLNQINAGGRVYADLDAVRAALPGELVSEHPYRTAGGRTDMIAFRCQVNGDKSYRPAHVVKGGRWRLAAPPKPWPLYARDAIGKSDTVIVVEGERCCDVLAPYGIAATTTPFGAGKAAHCDLTSLAGKNVVLWPDNDLTGRNHMQQVAELLEQIEAKPRVSYIEPNDIDLGDKEDVADFVQQLQAVDKTAADISTELHRLISKARPKGPLDKIRKRFRAIATGEYRNIELPWPLLGQVTQALRPNSVVLLVGTGGASKSFMALQAFRFFKELGESTAYFVLEGDVTDHLQRALAQITGTAGYTNTDWLYDNMLIAEAALSEHAEALESIVRDLSTSDGLGADTLEQIAEWVERQAVMGRRIIIVDPITAATRTDRPWIADRNFLNAAKGTCKRHGCSLLVVTHPTKGTLDPDLTNIAGGATYEQNSDVILTLHTHGDGHTNTIKTGCGRTEIEHNRTVRIEKVRNALGRGMRIAYTFDNGSLTMKEHGIIIKG